MKEFKGTPEEWEYKELGNTYLIHSKGDYDIAKVLNNNGSDQNKANAKLVVASPNVLEALLDIMESGFSIRTKEKAEKAIGKALGDEI